MSWQELIDNKLDGIDVVPFAAIIGANPSKGARSPLLWNAAFAATSHDTQMHPIDVQATGLEAVLEGLAADARFVGGAVTMPHKETIAAWLGPDRLTPEATRIGAVNCLYRNGQGALVGTNTDGEGALVSLERIAGPVAGKNVVLLGPGGAGKAVAAFLAGAGAQVTLAARDPQRAQDFAEKIAGDAIPISAVPDELSNTDILVNCTPVGFAQNDPNASPLDPSELAKLPSGAVVFDIIYDPDPTVLLAQSIERGLSVLNGGPMNLEQAILGFCYATPDADAKAVAAAMQGAR
jgi:shikimate dehydrogenase